MTYSIGIDIGTTATKTVAFSDRGEVLAKASFSYPMMHPQPDYSEQDPEAIFAAVVQGVQQVLQALQPDAPAFISFSTAMHSLILMDEKGKPLTPCIIWADNRAAAIAGRLKNSAEGIRFYQATGVPVHPMSPLCKLLWFKENEPQLFGTTARFIGIKEYVLYQLFGAFLVDTSVASATGLLNIKTLIWEEEILKYAGIDAGKLAALVSTKHICYYKNHYPKLTLSNDTPFILGASDGALSNLGSGAVSHQCMAVSIGTSSAVRMVVAAAQTDERMRTFCYHVNNGDYIIGGAGNNGAVVMQWLRDSMLKTDESYDTLYEQAATIAPGCNGLLMLPYLLGERAPLWDAEAKAVYFGLTIQHTKAHLVRATMEAIMYSVYSIGKIVAENKTITEIYASGGFTKSPFWLQMLADLFNVKVLVTSASQAAALGAVMIGAEAMNAALNVKNEIITTCYPDAKTHSVYQARFLKFERLYELLKEEMREA